MSQEIVIVCPLFSVKITGENERDLIRQAAFWLSLPTKCPLCRSTLALDYRTPKTFKYYTLKCNGTTTHCVNLGQAQADGSLYYDDKKAWELFRPGHAAELGAGTPESASPAASAPASSGNVDPLAAKRNALIKMISETKAKGIRTELNPPDVGRLTEELLNSEIDRIGKLLNPPA